MLWHLDSLSLLACENIVATIAFVVNILCSHKGPYAAVFVVLPQALSVLRLVVIEVEQVVCSASVIFLTRIEVVLFHFKHFCGTNVASLHVFKSLHFPLVALFAEVGPSVLNVFKLLLAHFLVSDSEVLVKSLLLCHTNTRIS